jgi:hypothetical protein
MRIRAAVWSLAPPAPFSAPAWWAWARWRAVGSRAPDRIIAVDLSEGRLAHARTQGATDTLVGGPDAVDQIVEVTGESGADYTFEATGNVAVMRQAVESARMGWGTLHDRRRGGEGRGPRGEPPAS